MLPFRARKLGALSLRAKQNGERSKMRTETLRDRLGRKLGEIETQHDGTLVARDALGQRKGTYDPRSNSTRDTLGRKLGEGNFLASLITSSIS
jgi:hypothetical protein